MATVCTDFDGVLHSYEHGWADGSIYGHLLPGATVALHAIMTRHAVIVQTCRTPLEVVAEWITGRTGITAVADDGTHRFWTSTDTILVTGRKLPAFVYIDDRGYRFEGWDHALVDLDVLMAP